MLTEQAAVLNRAPVLDAVGIARQLAEGTEANVRKAVDRARQDGSTWQQIGSVLGISRQAAFQRFGRAVDPRSGEVAPAADPRAADAALALINDLAAGQWQRATAGFDATMSEKLTPEAMAAAWAQVVGMCGALEKIGTPYAVRAGGFTVVNVPLQFEAADQQARISYNDELLVVGLYFLTGEES